MEQVLARFFWGASNDEKKTHWIKWVDCWRPFAEGGLGIRRFQDIVHAFSFKLWWRFRENQSLWAQYMNSKYCYRSSPLEVSPSRRHSPIWRRIFQAGQKIHHFMRWSLGEGNIGFWDDTWLEDVPLQELAISVSSVNKVLVRDFWRGDEWDRDKLLMALEQRGIPTSVFEKILETPFQRSEKDICRWTLTVNGNFSSASAWQLARTHQLTNSILSHFWCKALTPTMSIFLWRLVANRIPVDAKLQWRMVQMASKCRCCKASAVETAEHLFVESEAACRLWAFYDRWFPNGARAVGEVRSISQRLRHWGNAYPGSDHLHISSVIPCLVMWFLWLERNDCTFCDSPFRTSHVIWRINHHIERLILGGILSIEHWRGSVFQHPLLAGQRCKRRIIRAVKITWAPPLANWIKVNTDGAFSPSRNIAGGEGIIRDSDGKMISAFSTSFPASSSLEAELKAFELGITAAARHGGNIWMETDASTIVQMLSKNEHGPAPFRHIIRRIRYLLSGLNASVSFIEREGNKPADFLAEQGQEEQISRTYDPNTAPTRLRALVELDGKGIPNFRFFRRWTTT